MNAASTHSTFPGEVIDSTVIPFSHRVAAASERRRGVRGLGRAGELPPVVAGSPGPERSNDTVLTRCQFGPCCPTTWSSCPRRRVGTVWQEYWRPACGAISEGFSRWTLTTMGTHCTAVFDEEVIVHKALLRRLGARGPSGVQGQPPADDAPRPIWASDLSIRVRHRAGATPVIGSGGRRGEGQGVEPSSSFGYPFQVEGREGLRIAQKLDTHHPAVPDGEPEHHSGLATD